MILKETETFLHIDRKLLLEIQSGKKIQKLKTQTMVEKDRDIQLEIQSITITLVKKIDNRKTKRKIKGKMEKGKVDKKRALSGIHREWSQME